MVICALLQLSAATPDTSDDSYLPSAEGMEWTMNAKIIAPTGQELRGTAHRIVSGKEERDGKTYLRMTTTMRPDGFPPNSRIKLVRKDTKGIHSIDLSSPNAKEEVEIPLPIKVGNTWQTQFPTQVKHTVLAKETITIDGKAYKDCFKIHSESLDGKYVEDFWEAPVMGSVKSEFKEGPLKIMLTIREFKAGKSASK